MGFRTQAARAVFSAELVSRKSGASGLRIGVKDQWERGLSGGCSVFGELAPWVIQVLSVASSAADSGIHSGGIRPGNLAVTFCHSTLLSGRPATMTGPSSPPLRISWEASSRRPASCLSAP